MRYSFSLTILLTTTLIVMTLPGCASLGKVMKSNPFIGASVGASAGALSGTMIGSPEHGVRGAFIGTAVGAALGGVVGWLTEPKAETKSESKPEGVSSTDLGAPQLTPPVVRRVWQEDRIEDGKFIQGHYMWVLERSSVWRMP